MAENEGRGAEITVLTRRIAGSRSKLIPRFPWKTYSRRGQPHHRRRRRRLRSLTNPNFLIGRSEKSRSFPLRRNKLSIYIYTIRIRQLPSLSLDFSSN